MVCQRGKGLFVLFEGRPSAPARSELALAARGGGSRDGELGPKMGRLRDNRKTHSLVEAGRKTHNININNNNSKKSCTPHSHQSESVSPSLSYIHRAAAADPSAAPE